jgi:hypothetical protein
LSRLSRRLRTQQAATRNPDDTLRQAAKSRGLPLHAQATHGKISTVRRATLVLVLLACNPLPLDSDAGDAAGVDQSNGEAQADVSVVDVADEIAVDAGVDAPRSANEWILPVDMDGDPQAIASDSQGNVIIAGQTNSTTALFFTKFDRYGNVIWKKTFAGGFDGTGLAVDSSDALILTGIGSGSSFNVGGSTLGDGSFVAKFSPDGTHVWSKSLVPSTFDYAPRVALGANDGAIVTGRFQGTVNIAGGQALSGGGTYVVALTSAGAVSWSDGLGPGDAPRAVKSDGSGGAVMIGTGAICSSGGTQYVAHVNGSGTCTGVAIGDYFSPPGAIALDSAGNAFVLIGTIPQSSTCQGDFAFLLSKLDSSLSTLWTKCVSGGVYPQVIGGGLLADDAGNIIVSGTASGAADASINLGGGAITSLEAFIVRYAADGGYVSESLYPAASQSTLPYLMAPAPSPDVYVLGFAEGSLNILDSGVVDATGFLARVP